MPKKPRNSLIRDLWSGKYSMRVVRNRKKHKDKRRCREKEKYEQ